MFTTVSILKFGSHRFRALAAMGTLPRQLRGADGLRFYRLMGSGIGKAFSLRPDFSRYFFLATWDSEPKAHRFFAQHKAWNRYACYASGIAQLHLEPLSSKGTWNGQEPFGVPAKKMDSQAPLVILTRARLRVSGMPSFWRHARTSTSDLYRSAGLIYSAGIGEVPYLEQATFSIWESAAKMKDFSHSPAHIRAVQLRHKENWYREELFARFTLKGGTLHHPEHFEELVSLPALAGDLVLDRSAS